MEATEWHPSVRQTNCVFKCGKQYKLQTRDLCSRAKKANIDFKGDAAELMPDAKLQPPYEGAKDTILVDNVDDRTFPAELFRAMYDELPSQKKEIRWYYDDRS